MSSRNIVYLFIVILMTFGHFASGQSLEARARIMRHTNTKTLHRLADSIQNINKINKAKAYRIAIKKGLPLKQVKDGTEMALQGITPEGRLMYYETHNATAAATTSTDQLYPGASPGFDLDGTEMIIGEWDGGDVRITHQEFNNTGQTRVTDMDGVLTNSDHSTHVAGTLIAGGVQTNAKGMAYNAALEAYDWDNDQSEMTTAGAGGLLLSNHSYGYITGWNGGIWYGTDSISTEEDYGFGFYGATARYVDYIALLSPYYLICKSAGNDRNDDGEGHPPDGGVDGYDCIGWWGNAKNILTIGAVDDLANGYTGNPSDVTMSSFSSWGPADDGRIKPDLVGNGVGLYSSLAGSDSQYESYSGTSMAAPNVAGSLLLLQQLYQETIGFFMKAATLKALAIHTADEAGPNEGPDYQFGWGLFNALSAAELIANEHVSSLITETSLSEGETYSLKVDVSGTEEFIATIVWTDIYGPELEPALDPADTILVNDLDMTVSDVSTRTTWMPYRLDGLNPSNAATTGDNDLDNVEKIIISNPTAGIYTISVSHEGTLSYGPQDFSLIISGVEHVALPELSVVSTSNITATTAQSGGDVTTSGDAPVTARGVCWSSLPHPDLTDDHTLDGTGTGAFVSEITGLEPHTTYYVKAYASNAYGTKYSDETFFTTEYGSLAWTGQVSTSWNETDNWNQATIPTPDYDVTIGGGVDYSPLIEVGEEDTVHHLTLLSDGALSIEGQLTVEGNTTIQSDVSGTGSMIVKGTLTNHGTTTIGRYISNDNTWHLLSSPVAEQAIQGEFVPAGTLLPLDFDFYFFDETITDGYPWINIRGSEQAVNESFESTFKFGRGYLVAYTTAYGPDFNFSGVPNTVAFDTILPYTAAGNNGWNLMGNPYTAAIDWSSVDKTPLAEDYFYVYDNAANGGAGDYVFSNGTTGTTSAYISPGQGFFVRVAQNAAFRLDVSNLAHADQSFLKASSLSDVLEISLLDDNFYDEVLIGVNPEAAFQKDRYDASKLFSYNTSCPSVYALTADGIPVAFNMIPETGSETVIALGASFPREGNYRLVVSRADTVFSASGIFLEDLLTGMKHDFLRDSVYFFTALEGSLQERFRIHLNKTTIGLPEEPAENVNIAVHQFQLIISRPEAAGTGQVAIYNIMGQMMYRSQITAPQTIIPIDKAGVYLVKISDPHQVYAKKVLIGKY